MENKYKSVPVKSSEITPYSQYLSRRDFLKAAGLVTGSALLAACAPRGTEVTDATVPTSNQTDEFGDPVNSYTDITNYNNFYEFSTRKDGVAPLSRNFVTRPWTVEVQRCPPVAVFDVGGAHRLRKRDLAVVVGHFRR